MTFPSCFLDLNPPLTWRYKEDVLDRCMLYISFIYYLLRTCLTDGLWKRMFYKEEQFVLDIHKLVFYFYFYKYNRISIYIFMLHDDFFKS